MIVRSNLHFVGISRFNSSMAGLGLDVLTECARIVWTGQMARSNARTEAKEIYEPKVLRAAPPWIRSTFIRRRNDMTIAK